MQSVPKKRMRGACRPCARKKRKCDHKYPRCTQCEKHDDVCEMRNFKTWGQPLDSQAFVVPTAQQAKVTKSVTTKDSRNVFPTHSSSRSPSFSQIPDAYLSNMQVAGAMIHPNVVDRTANVLGSFAQPLPFGPQEALERSSSSSDSSFIYYDPSYSTSTGPDSLQMNMTGLLTSASMYQDTPYVPGLMPDTVDEIIEDFVDASKPQPYLYNPSPFPDDMLVSPEKRFLWDYFFHGVKANILSLDTCDIAHLHDFQDPYNTILPCIALDNPVLRGALLCGSALQFKHIHGQDSWTPVAESIGSNTLQQLRMYRSAPPMDSSNILALMLAASFLHFFRRDRRDGCLELAAGYAMDLRSRSKSQTQPALPSKNLDMSLTAFRWSIISTLCSLRMPDAPLVPSSGSRIIELDDEEVTENFSSTFQHWVTHPLYVFSPRLVNPLLRIGKLLERQLLGETELDDEIRVAEKMLHNAREADDAFLSSPYGVADPKSALAANEAMHASSLILVYARLKQMPYTSPLIRKQVQIVVDEVAKISVNSRVSHTILFPLFIAGCEAVDLQARESIQRRLMMPKGEFFNKKTGPASALDHIWEIRDLEPGLLWPHWIYKVAPEHRVDSLF
ncbi:hypothetical protein BU24DRAFT_414758 [Aaosphaeria arxii CBS 175.79]|uniref:Zn(2)-C6 fungal-type domain-containing protein n=1 Tax=Aaosphaeria arxii CBS 175.79 TaxID=1450172 RepID=A0A6A5X9I3_9PLEO|nr:uncharacterized protein BU24DRAFT_414758 [Aaosphaeria arxii CBS 175.79]KAF2009427.1 hypothetical protein BU24DRAFT_414758 [Aaosphaeria arxii CBS 175.79]